MEKNSLLQYFMCPITKLIFCDPVLADDGNFYECMAIKNYLSKNTISPIAGKKIGPILLKATTLKKMTDDFITSNPEYANDRFLFKKPFFLFVTEFLDLLRDKKYDQLKEFTSIMLNTDIGKETLFSIVCKTCPDDVIKYILDNSIDYDVYDRNSLKPLHIACKHASNDVVVYLAKKGVDINSGDINGETPLSYLLLYRENCNELITDFLELGADSNQMNKNGFTPAHYVIKDGNVIVLKIFIKYKLNIGTTINNLGCMNLLQYAFKESTQDVIKYLIDLNINLDVDIDPKTPSEQLIYMNLHLDKKQKQQLVLYYLTQILKKPTIIEDFMVNMQENISETN